MCHKDNGSGFQGEISWWHISLKHISREKKVTFFLSSNPLTHSSVASWVGMKPTVDEATSKWVRMLI